MKSLKVSVIIPIYNGSLLINRCLNSVLKQNGEYELEIIVIDDGSTDNSKEIVKSFTEDIILINQKNQGPAIARNKGIDYATGKYLAFLDADDYWEIDFLNETVNFMENQPEAIAVSVGQKHRTLGKKEFIVPNFLTKENINFTSLVLPNFYEFWGNYNHVCTGSVLIRTDIAKLTGGQQSEFRITEDLEFWAFLATFGQWGFIPKVLMISDGGIVTRNIGWLDKMKNRWDNAPSMEEWEQRIQNRMSEPLQSGYLKSRGTVASNLAYCQMLSGRHELSKEQIKKYGKYFPKDKISRLLKLAVKNNILWFIISKTLTLREYHR